MEDEDTTTTRFSQNARTHTSYDDTTHTPTDYNTHSCQSESLLELLQQTSSWSGDATPTTSQRGITDNVETTTYNTDIVLPPSNSLTPSTHTTYSSKGNKQYYIIHCNHILLLAFTATPGLTAQSLQEPIDYFHLLFTEEVKNNVFIETCKYADQKTTKCRVLTKSQRSKK